MTLRSLFNIILKIFGILFIKDFLLLLPGLLTAVFFLDATDSLRVNFGILASSLLTLLILGTLAYLLIFRTGLITNKLKLDKGFDVETIPLNIHRSTVLSISLIVIGGYIAANEIPNLIKQLYFYFQYKRTGYNEYHQSLSYFILSAVKIIIGFLLIKKQRLLVNLIERKRKN
jgi:hypothetical protein